MDDPVRTCHEFTYTSCLSFFDICVRKPHCANCSGQGRNNYRLCSRRSIAVNGLYQRIGELDPEKEHELITVTGGEHAGMHVLLRRGRWPGAAGRIFCPCRRMSAKRMYSGKS